MRAAWEWYFWWNSQIICQLLNKYQAAFSNSSKDIGHTELITMDIDTGMSCPVFQRPYTLPLKHHDWIKKEIEQIECAGVIERVSAQGPVQ